MSDTPSGPDYGFVPGQKVRIADRTPPVHHRVPAYAKGRTGHVVRVCRAYGQPEGLAYGRDGRPYQRIYRVRLRQPDLWPDYAGPATDTLDIEIFAHWLEPA